MKNGTAFSKIFGGKDRSKIQPKIDPTTVKMV